MSEHHATSPDRHVLGADQAARREDRRKRTRRRVRADRYDVRAALAEAAGLLSVRRPLVRA